MKMRTLKTTLTLAVSAFLMVGCASLMKAQRTTIDKNAMLEKAFIAAKENNWGIVVMPTFHASKIMTWKLTEDQKMNTLLATHQTKMIWQHKDSADSVFFSSTKDGLISQDSRAALLNLSYFDGTYQIFIVEPGVYGLIGSETIELGGKLQPTGTTQVVNANTIGRSFVEQKDMTEYYKSVEWEDATYRTEVRSAWVCNQQHASGVCLQSAESKHRQEVLDKPAGYYERWRTNVEPGLVYTNFLLKPFAMFEVKPGEVVLTDAFFASGKNVTFQAKSCLESDDKIECSVNSFEASQLKTSAGIYQKAVIDGLRTDKGMSQYVIDTLNSAEYKPLKIFAKVDKNKSSRIGAVYNLK